MTSTTTTEPEALAVTQADREAAAQFYGKYLARPGEVPVEAAFRFGSVDESPLIQAFARHRIAALSTPAARMIALNEVDPDICRSCGEYYHDCRCPGELCGPPAAEPVGLREALYAARDVIRMVEMFDKGTPLLTFVGQQQVERAAALVGQALATPARTDDAGVGDVTNFPPSADAEMVKLLDLIETADEHGDECTIVEQASRVRAALSPAPDRGEVDAELIERVRYAVDHPDAQGFLLAKASMTRHDFRRILAALKPADATPAGEAVQMDDSKFEAIATAFAKEFYGPGFDPFHNPEAYDLIERGLRVAIQSGEGKV